MSSPTTDVKADAKPEVKPEIKAGPKMVKIKALHPIRVYTMAEDGEGKPIKVENVVQPDTEVEVTEAEAREFCDKTFDLGYTDIFGERDDRDIKKTFRTRAVRVK